MQTCGVWMAAWLEHAECQLQAVDQVFFAVRHTKKLQRLKVYTMDSSVKNQEPERNCSCILKTVDKVQN